MTPDDYSEDALVEQPAIALFAELGWQTANCFYEQYGAGGTLGRETKGEVVLTARLRPALERLNPTLDNEAIRLAIEELSRDRSAMSLAHANREVYQLLKNGVKVTVKGGEDGGEETVEMVRVIDWNAPANNDFFLASQFWVAGDTYTRRADLVGFINGLPLVFVELKAAHKALQTAYDNNLKDYKAAVPHLFWYNGLVILSNGSRSKAGSVTAAWEHFAEWKRINSEGEKGVVSMETMIRGTCEPARLLEVVENFTLFQMEDLLEGAELDEDQERRLERDFAREYHLITRDDRLETVAKDVVSHFLGRGQKGKAMVVSIDKATAVRTYDKVQKHWRAYLKDLKKRLASAPEDQRARLREELKYVEETDMAVVVSQSQNEIEEMKKKGLDIAPHRRRLVDEDLDTKFKDPNDPFRIVFVCAMWMTGFDVPSCSTIYLDKPMRNHTLMQTIARANRVFRDKVNGLIVDYINVFKDLQKALAIYGSAAGGGVAEGDSPVQNKAELVGGLRQAIAEALAFCSGQGIDPAAIQAAKGFQRIKLLDDAVEALIGTDEAKRKYLLLAAGVARLYKAILPDPTAAEFAPSCVLLGVLAEKIRSLTPPADISAVVEQVGQLLDRSVASEGYVIRESTSPYATGGSLDLSQIDFEALKARFDEGRKRTEAERLRGAVRSKLQKLVRLNRTRMDYLAKFQEMIDAYNAGSLNVDEFFRQLLAFAQGLNQEEKRHIGEQLTEEELALFDLLTRPAIKLGKKDQAQVKKVARELLETLKREKLVLDWRKKQQARAAVQVCIRDYLEQLPPAFTPELCEEKCALAYQHVYDSYLGEGRGIYPAA